MKKTTILIIVVLFMVIGYAAYNTTINIYGNGKLAENLSDFKVYLSSLKVNGKEISGINNTKDEFTINDINGDISVDVINDSTEYDTETYLECIKEDENVGKVWNYDYTGGEQTFTAPKTGTLLENGKLPETGHKTGGGSGYIENSPLSNKAMYCYNCQESSEDSTKTISTTCTSATPTENCAKSGNGYARITLISTD